LEGETRNMCKTLLGIPVHYVCLEDTAREGKAILKRYTERYINYQMLLQGLKSLPVLYVVINEVEI
jgi:hypothetical protein